jgi:hypothetical protein
MYGEFAAAWAEALGRHQERRAAEEAGEIAAVKKAPPPPFGSPSAEKAGEDAIGNGQVRRAGHGRWSTRKEKLFFDELAATNNIKRSAKAAGVSYNAVLARRLKHPLFRAKWEAVAQSAKASIGMHLLEASKATFDPDTLDLPDTMPKVTVAEAIRISESKTAKQEPADPFDDGQYSYENDIADIRERLVQKLQAMRRRDRPELLAQGWSYDEEYDSDIPPGWVRAERRRVGGAAPARA